MPKTSSPIAHIYNLDRNGIARIGTGTFLSAVCCWLHGARFEPLIGSHFEIEGGYCLDAPEYIPNGGTGLVNRGDL